MATPIQTPNELDQNPVGLKTESVAEIVENLDELVSSLFLLFHLYQKHHWIVEGPQFRDLHEHFENSYDEVHEDLDAVAERMTVLGAVPTSGPGNQEDTAFVEKESEGMFPIRKMLELDLKNERKLAVQLREHIPVTTREADFATETLLKQVLVRVEDRAHHLDHYLSSDSLEKHS